MGYIASSSVSRDVGRMAVIAWKDSRTIVFWVSGGIGRAWDLDAPLRRVVAEVDGAMFLESV